jgi:hypothetical protein
MTCQVYSGWCTTMIYIVGMRIPSGDEGMSGIRSHGGMPERVVLCLNRVSVFIWDRVGRSKV